MSDPHLAAHLAHWGINTQAMEKTEKSMTELQIEANENLQLDKITEAGKELRPLKGPGYVGLKNLGNSCYVNACLRALHATHELKDLLLRGPPPTSHSEQLTPSKRSLEPRPPPAVTPRLREALALLDATARPVVSATRLRSALRSPYDGTDQQDAAEFLHYVVDALEEEDALDDDAAIGRDLDAKRLLDGVFGGVLETSIHCARCGTVSTRRADLGGFLEVCVPDDVAAAPRKNDTPASPPAAAHTEASAAKPISLRDLVKAQYLADETLEGDSAYECDVCGVKGPATRSHRFERFPNHVVCSLGRFRYDGLANRRRKVTTPVDVPRVLAVDDARYALYATVVARRAGNG